MKKGKVLFIFSLLIPLLSLTALRCTSGNTEPVKIGLLLAITDKDNPDFTGNKEDRIQAAKLAAEEINDAGGIFGRPIEILVEDSRNDNDFAAHGAMKLIGQGVSAIIGPCTSAQLEHVADSVTVRKGIVIISPSATASSLNIVKNEQNNLVWRTCPSDEFQAEAAARYIKNDLKKHSLAILYLNNTYGRAFANTLAKKFLGSDRKVTAIVSYPPESEDNMSFNFSAYMPRLLKGNPDIVYVISSSEAAGIFKDMKAYLDEKKLPKPMLMGSDGNYDSRVLQHADKTFIDGMVGTAPASSKDNENFRLFSKNYMEKYNTPIKSAWAASTYDAVYLMAYSMLYGGEQKILNAKPAELSGIIAANLREVSEGGTIVNVGEYSQMSELVGNHGNIDYEGASGNVNLDMHGNVVSGTYLVWKVDHGSFAEVKTLRFP